MDAASFKKYEMQARVIAAVAHPIRIAILELLRDGEVCVCEIAQRVGAERSNVSRHLGIMLKAGIVKTRKEGVQVMYALRTPCILNFLACATRSLEQNLKEEVSVLIRS